MKTYKSLGLACALALIAGCGGPKPPPPLVHKEAPAPDATAIRAELDAQVQKVMMTLQNKDVPGFVGAFTDDATWILPDATTSRGKAEIEKTVTAFLDSIESATVSSSGVDRLVVISDSEAVTFSTAAYTMTMKGKKPQNRINPFADYWKKGADGVWRIAYEVNAEGAAPEATAQNP
jgi:uncharacterized protein (TIGR02246 family)